jgi:DNA polymerase I
VFYAATSSNAERVDRQKGLRIWHTFSGGKNMPAQKFAPAGSHEYVTPAGLRYTYITQPSGAAELAQRLMRERVTAHDTETTGLDFLRDKVTLASYSTPTENFVLDCRNPDNLRAMKPYYEKQDTFKIAHNAPFDGKMIKGTAGIDVENPLCLMIGEQALEVGNQFDGFGLDAVAKKYLGIQMDKEMQKSFIGHTGDFSRGQLDYSATDTAYLIPLGKKMQERMVKEQVIQTWRTECAAIPAFCDIEFYGQKLDPDMWREVMQTNLEKAGLAKKDLDAIFEPVCDRNLFGELEMDYDSPAQLLLAFRRLNVMVDGQPIQNTNKRTQKKLRDLPVMQALMRYRTAVKLYGTYGQNYIDGIDPLTGRVHFRFRQYGTATGRPACYNNLNCLNIPRDPRYRMAFITDPDRLISTVDYSGAELRILADLSGDPLMVEGFNSGEDFHCFVATMLFGRLVTKKNENAHLRTPTKAINFGEWCN